MALESFSDFHSLRENVEYLKTRLPELEQSEGFSRRWFLLKTEHVQESIRNQDKGRPKRNYVSIIVVEIPTVDSSASQRVVDSLVLVHLNYCYQWWLHKRSSEIGIDSYISIARQGKKQSLSVRADDLWWPI